MKYKNNYVRQNTMLLWGSQDIWEAQFCPDISKQCKCHDANIKQMQKSMYYPATFSLKLCPSGSCFYQLFHLETRLTFSPAFIFTNFILMAWQDQSQKERLTLKTSSFNSSFIYPMAEGIKPCLEHRCIRNANTSCKTHQIIYNFLRATNFKLYYQCNGTA